MIQLIVLAALFLLVGGVVCLIQAWAVGGRAGVQAWWRSFMRAWRSQ